MRKTILILLILLTSCQTPNSLLTDKYKDYLYALFEFQIEKNDQIKTEYIDSGCKSQGLYFIDYSDIKFLSDNRTKVFSTNNNYLQKLQNVQNGNIYFLDYYFGLDFKSFAWSDEFSLAYEKDDELFSVKIIENDKIFDSSYWELLKKITESQERLIDNSTEFQLARKSEGTYVSSKLTIQNGKIIDFQFYVW